MNHVLPVVTMAVLLALSGRAGTQPARPHQAIPPVLLPIHIYLPWAGQAPSPTLVWRTRAPLLATRSNLGAAATAAGKVYVVGGRHYEGLLGPVEAYDPATDTWPARAPIPTARSGLGVALAADGRIYAVGGLAGFQDRTIVATVEAYDPASDAWPTRASMPTARYGLGLAAADGRLYAMGGCSTLNAWLNTVIEYNPATSLSRSVAPLDFARRGRGGAVASNGRIYAIGGRYFAPRGDLTVVEEATVQVTP